MATEKKTATHSQMTEGKRSLVRQLIQEYAPKTALDIRMRSRISSAAPSKKCWKLRWIITLATASLKDLTTPTPEMDIRPSRSAAVWESSASRYRRTGSLLSSPRSSRSVRKTSLKSNPRSSPCTEKGLPQIRFQRLSRISMGLMFPTVSSLM